MNKPQYYLRHLAIITIFSLLGGGCGNALFFYETEKFSLTLEGKPDATEPVSGNLGVKQRVVLVVPAKKAKSDLAEINAINASTQPAETLALQEKVKRQLLAAADSEALSVVSYFDLNKTKSNKAFVADPVTIRTLFVTGDAAAALDSKEAGELLKTAAVGRFETAAKEEKTQASIAKEAVDAFLALSDANADLALTRGGPKTAANPNGLDIYADAPVGGADRNAKNTFFKSRVGAYVSGTEPGHLAQLKALLAYLKSLN